MNLGFHLFLALACVSALFVRRWRYHEMVGVACAGAIATYIALLFAHLR